jgi:hypothetical protein
MRTGQSRVASGCAVATKRWRRDAWRRYIPEHFGSELQGLYWNGMSHRQTGQAGLVKTRRKGELSMSRQNFMMDDACAVSQKESRFRISALFVRPGKARGLPGLTM